MNPGKRRWRFGMAAVIWDMRAQVWYCSECGSPVEDYISRPILEWCPKCSRLFIFEASVVSRVSGVVSSARVSGLVQIDKSAGTSGNQVEGVITNGNAKVT